MKLGAVALIVTLALSILMAPLSSNAQLPAKVPRLGLLSPFSPADTARWYQAFRQGLRDLGWVGGDSMKALTRIVTRSASDLAWRWRARV